MIISERSCLLWNSCWISLVIFSKFSGILIRFSDSFIVAHWICLPLWSFWLCAIYCSMVFSCASYSWVRIIGLYYMQFSWQCLWPKKLQNVHISKPFEVWEWLLLYKYLRLSLCTPSKIIPTGYDYLPPYINLDDELALS